MHLLAPPDRPCQLRRWSGAAKARYLDPMRYARIRASALSCPRLKYRLSLSVGAKRCVFVGSVYSALLGSCRVRRIELPIALLDSARPLVSGDGDADMVRANPLACGGDFLLRLASCQGKDLIAEAWRAAIDASRFRRCGASAST